MNFLDVGVGIFIIWGAYQGYKKGLMHGLVTMGSYILALLAGVSTYEPVAKMLTYKFGIGEMLAPTISKVVSLPPSVYKIPMASFSQDMVLQGIGKLNLPPTYQNEMLKMVNKLASYQSTPGVNTIGDGIIRLITEFVVSMLAFVLITFVVERFISLIISGVKNKAIPDGVKLFDGLVGAALGSGKNLITVAVFFVVIQPMLAMGSNGGIIASLSQGVEESTIAPVFMNFIQSMI